MGDTSHHIVEDTFALFYHANNMLSSGRTTNAPLMAIILSAVSHGGWCADTQSHLACKPEIPQPQLNWILKCSVCIHLWVYAHMQRYFSTSECFHTCASALSSDTKSLSGENLVNYIFAEAEKSSLDLKQLVFWVYLIGFERMPSDLAMRRLFS